MRTNISEIELKVPKAPHPIGPVSTAALEETIKESSRLLLDLQSSEGYWWFTLEANETIGAGYIQLMHFLEEVDPEIQSGLVERILHEQREDGTWGLYYGAPGDLSTTVECYFSLRLAGFKPDSPPLQKARRFILSQGGLTQIRVFTRIHLALFGLVPWSACPVMPPEMILLPPWAPLNIYHFSSWARASIVPLLVVLHAKPVRSLKEITLEELFVEPSGQRQWPHSRKTSPVSLERLFLLADRGMKFLGKVPFKPWRGFTLQKAIDWIWEHIQKTEDIYPALAYAALAFKAYGFKNDSPQIRTALQGLKNFQQKDAGPGGQTVLHQQCCISPGWDTPWSLAALLEAGTLAPEDKRGLKAGRWLLAQEVTNPDGDWRMTNPQGIPGGWSFEFKNEYFPDVDDTIEVLKALMLLNLPPKEKGPAFRRGLAWLLSMQNDDGGWGAFDKNNDLQLVNKIPFADHGACLDPSTPDITGRCLELLVKTGMGVEEKPVKKALQFLRKSQEKFGGWYGRWGVNYIYGTWCVLTGLAELGDKNPLKKESPRACEWLMSIQNEDGGFSESPESYFTKKFHPYPESVASQTAWAVMGLIAAGRQSSLAVQQGIQFLLDRFKEEGWAEPYHTGTGFPGHFYIRYHGYRYYFPLLALARYRKSTVG